MEAIGFCGRDSLLTDQAAMLGGSNPVATALFPSLLVIRICLKRLSVVIRIIGTSASSDLCNSGKKFVSKISTQIN